MCEPCLAGTGGAARAGVFETLYACQANRAAPKRIPDNNLGQVGWTKLGLNLTVVASGECAAVEEEKRGCYEPWFGPPSFFSDNPTKFEKSGLLPLWSELKNTLSAMASQDGWEMVPVRCKPIDHLWDDVRSQG